MEVAHSKSKLFYYLRVWIGFVGLMAFGNAVQCFVDDSFIKSRLYTREPSQVTGLVARLFGVWTLLAGVLRLYCAIDIYNKSVYNLTFVSFILAFGHFLSELCIYHTAHVSFGVMSPIVVSGFSMLAMLIGYRYLNPKTSFEDVSTKFKTKRS
ncbi:ergosterol biosynthetic protein 28 homolog [Gigantopelta aegis]|uniref:ergosterol biosynthetic protein 28 homolog n=1 Tax=Gigantopelta aegis TaxID=1735272 RepID=UPI001B88A10B|nr:ergosterol biosynthetic protein 28 homolog [Gigantopelta aegis]